MEHKEKKETEPLCKVRNLRCQGQTQSLPLQPRLDYDCPAPLTRHVTAQMSVLLHTSQADHAFSTSSPLHKLLPLLKRPSPPPLLNPALSVLTKRIHGRGGLGLWFRFTVYFLRLLALSDVRVAWLTAHLPHETTEFSRAGTASTLFLIATPAPSSHLTHGRCTTEDYGLNGLPAAPSTDDLPF